MYTAMFCGLFFSLQTVSSLQLSLTNGKHTRANVLVESLQALKYLRHAALNH